MGNANAAALAWIKTQLANATAVGGSQAGAVMKQQLAGVMGISVQQLSRMLGQNTKFGMPVAGEPWAQLALQRLQAYIAQANLARFGQPPPGGTWTGDVHVQGSDLVTGLGGLSGGKPFVPR